MRKVIAFLMATEEQQLREKSDEEMIGGAFQHLIDTYADRSRFSEPAEYNL